MEPESWSDQVRTIGDWIASQRGVGFVGRSAELALFDRALRGELIPTVLYVHGPGGCGKSALLEAMRRRASELGYQTHWSDGTGREIWPTSAAVVFVDSLEPDRTAATLRDTVLPAVPAKVLVVLASRHPPDAEWRRSGWERVVTEIPLAGLSDQESATLLVDLGVPADRTEGIRRWAAGLPLSLVLGGKAALDGGVVREAEIAAQVMAVVGEGELNPKFHDALQTSAIARVTTPALLGRVLDTDQPAAFDWLATRSFIDVAGGELTLHAMVRETLRTALASFSPERDHELRRRVCDDAYRRALAGDRLAIADLAHLVNNEAVQWGYRLVTGGRYRATSVREGDAALVGARLDDRGYQEWWSLSLLYYLHPEAHIIVARDQDGSPAGHAIGFVPAAAPRELMAADPIGADCATYAGRIGAASTTLVWRDTVVLPDDRDDAAAAGVCNLLNITLALRADVPRIRHALIPAFERSARVHELCRAVGGRLVPDLQWTVDGRALGCYHVDWGTGGLSAAQRNMVYQELQVHRPDRMAVADVQRMLDAFASDEVLSVFPVATGTTASDRAESVRALLQHAAESAFRQSPHAEQLQAIVDRRYFGGCDAHDSIARSLSVSRATYFRRLREAVDLISTHVLGNHP